jgi:hypothetical protein
MSMILEAQMPLPRSATSEELFSMGLQDYVKASESSDAVGVSPADGEEILLCF